MKKIVTVLLTFFLLLIPFQVKAYEEGIENYFVDAEVQANGDIKVKELFVLNGDFNGYERIINYKNNLAPKFDGTMNSFKGSDIYNGSGIDIVSVKAISVKNDGTFEDIYTEGDLFEQVTSASKGDYGKYTKTNTSTGVSLNIYNPSKKKKSGFYVEYTLKNMGIIHNDVAEIGWNLFSKELREDVNHFEAQIKIPNNKQEFRAWAHGPLTGEIKLSGKDKIILTIDNLAAQTAIDTRFVFDKNILSSSSKKSNVNALDTIIKLETELADEANQEREYYYKQLEQSAITAVEIAETEKTRESYNIAFSAVDGLRQGEVKEGLLTRLAVVLKDVEKTEKTVKIIDVCVCAIFLLGLGLLIRKVYVKYDKEHKADFDGKYYRDFPAEYGPSTVGYLLHRNISNDDLSASILNLIYKKVISFEKIEGTKDDFVLSKKEGINLSETENLLVDFLFMDGDTTSLGELKKKAKKDYEAFIKKYTSWKNRAKTDAENEKFFEETGGAKALYSLYPILGMVLAFATFMYPIYSGLHVIIIILCIASLLYFFGFTKKTQKGINDYKKWTALKAFMEDFGNMDKKELPEIILWEKYLVYAVSLGCAEQLSKTMQLRIQEWNETGYMVGQVGWDFHYFYMMTAFSRTINTTISNAVTSAYSAQSVANSSNSSGGGFGGGFSGGFGGGGGGGSFGGGGGGGRF